HEALLRLERGPLVCLSRGHNAISHSGFYPPAKRFEAPLEQRGSAGIFHRLVRKPGTRPNERSIGDRKKLFSSRGDRAQQTHAGEPSWPVFRSRQTYLRAVLLRWTLAYPN